MTYCAFSFEPVTKVNKADIRRVSVRKNNYEHLNINTYGKGKTLLLCLVNENKNQIFVIDNLSQIPHQNN